ncbi:MAG: ATP-dependent helicase [Bernardetiaceae bacterium]
MSDSLDHLNEPQRQGVLNTEGPTLIIAGAGSGKTRVLTYRIAHLMQKNVPAHQILALTFTNKAARQMQERIAAVVGEQSARYLWMGTFHSIFSRLLRIEAHHLGYDRNFTIYDTDDSVSLLRTIIKENNLDDKVYPPKAVLGRISNAKNRLVSWQEYNRKPIYAEQDQQAKRPEVGRIYRLYAQRCKQANAMDFDDLLFETNVLFRDHPEVLQKYQDKFRYVLIDEFQDTNLAQYLIVRRISEKHRNICAVGDDAQSIYAFRGADIQNILNFERDYPQLTTIKLEQNYRSTKTIVAAANKIIGNNQDQLQKNVWTDNQNGEKVEVFKATTDIEEGRLVSTSIFEQKTQKGLIYSDFAILYRTNAQSRAMEESLRRLNIPYRVVGGLSFYQRKEIKDLVAYFRLVVNPNDEEAFKRIINLPKRGIGGTSVSKILLAAQAQQVPLWQILQHVEKYLPGRIGNAVSDFVEMIALMQKSLDKKNAFEAASYIAKQSGLLKALFDDQTIEGRTRYDNVQELLNAAQSFVEKQQPEEGQGLADFLQEVSLLTSADQTDENDDAVTLMTIHSAKGLEFKHVYLVGLEEDLFPSSRMIASRSELEEERRLFYVAITRAERRLTLSYALQRYRFGSLRPCEPSRFLFEMDPNLLTLQAFAPQEEPMTNFVRKKAQERKTASAPPAAHTPSAKFRPAQPSEIKAHMRVEHLKFGLGNVLKLEETPNGKAAKVRFDKFGEKTLLLSFAKLSIV